MKLSTLQKRIEYVSKNLNLFAVDAIRASKEHLIKLQQEQMLAGFDSKGEQIGTYHPLTVEYRGQKGLQTDHVDLRDTGDFFKNMEVFVNDMEFTFTSKDAKTGDIIERYGSRIWGINDKERQNKIIEVKLIELIKKYLYV